MLSLSLAWHIVWFLRVSFSCALVLVIVRHQIYRQFPLFAIHSAWIAVAGSALVAMNYAPFVSGYQYLVGVAVSNGVEAVLAFAIIYQMFAQTVQRYPRVGSLGVFSFRGITLALVAIATVLAWSAPGGGAGQLTSIYSVIQRTMRTLQCGQLVFLFLFCGYFRLSWRTRTFGIALGLGILTSISLATSAIHSQIPAGQWSAPVYALALLNDSGSLAAVLVWMFYLLAPEQASLPLDEPASRHDLENWNQELERLLEP